MFIAPTPFFTPSRPFLAWMAEHYAANAIIDAGCGYGNLTEALLQNGCPGAIGIDLLGEKLEQALERHPGAVHRLIQGDTKTHEIVRIDQAVIVFARPCHDAKWIAGTVENAKATASTFLYISKAGNAVSDLDGFERRRVCADMEVGAEGEEVWEFRPVPAGYDEDGLTRWCLIGFREIPGAPEAAVWVREVGDNWYWGWGPAHMAKRGEPVFQDAFIVEDWLDWSLGTVWQTWHKRVDDESLDNGWVSPEGRIYRCAFWEHVTLATSYLRRECRDLEQQGWCKLQRDNRGDDDGRRGAHTFTMGWDHKGNDRAMTKEQVQALIDAGFTPPTYRLEEAEGDWSEIVAQQDDGEFGGIVELVEPRS